MKSLFIHLPRMTDENCGTHVIAITLAKVWIRYLLNTGHLITVCQCVQFTFQWMLWKSIKSML